MTSILDIIQQGRRDLIMGEITMTQRMVDAYALVWAEVERQLLRLEDNLLAADVPIGSDEATLQWLRSQAWYQQLMTSVDAQFARFGADARSIVGQTQVGAVHVSQDVSGKVRSWIDDRAKTGFSAKVRPPVMERWVSVLQPDSPLRGSIERHGAEAAEVIERRMTEGLGTGKGSRAIVRGIRDELGPDSPREYELATLVRTETMRSYRGAFQDEMEAVGTEVIPQKEWLSAHGPRTCAACLARDGMRVPIDYPDDMHVSCRCRWIPVIDESIVPGANPPRKTGAEWFAEQDEETQRKILGAPGRFEAYQAGVSLSEMVGVRENAIWGPSIHLKPVRDLTIPSPASSASPPATVGELKGERDVVPIGTPPSGTLATWPDRVTDDIVVTRERRGHYLDSHPEVEAYEDLLVQTLLDPSFVYEVLDVPLTAIFGRVEDERHDFIAIVRISDNPVLKNSVITSRRQARRKRGKPASRNRLVWEKEAEDEE